MVAACCPSSIGTYFVLNGHRGYPEAIEGRIEPARPPGDIKLNLPSKLAGNWDVDVESARERGLDFTVSTVHGAKGHEYDGVLVVLPPPSARTSELLDAWENRDWDHEGRSVLFVAMTRARLQLAIAVPREHAARVEGLMKRNGAAVEIQQVGPMQGRTPTETESTANQN